MPIVTIDSDLGSRGEQVAQQAAEGLAYRLILGGEILAEAARRYELPQEQLRRAFEPPALLDLARARRAHARACYGAVLLERLQQDGAVYHGQGAHRWVVGISHAVRVRVTAAPEQRAAWHAEAAGLGLPAARKAVKASDAHRRRDAAADDEVSAEPDLIVDSGELQVAGAAAQVVALAGERRFAPMTYSLQRMREIELEGRVRAEVLAIAPTAQITLDEQTVRVRLVSSRRPSESQVEQLRRRALAIDEIEDVDVQVVVDRLGG